jgi:hypothetical protein
VSDPKSAAAELAELRAKQAEREAKRAEEIEAGELELARLIEKFENELGPQGRMFEVIDARELGDGIIVVKRPEPTQHKRFVAAIDKANNTNKPVDEADTAQYVSPNVVHPSREAYLVIAGARPEIGGRCSVALMRLMGAKRKDDSGKY